MFLQNKHYEYSKKLIHNFSQNTSRRLKLSFILFSVILLLPNLARVHPKWIINEVGISTPDILEVDLKTIIKSEFIDNHYESLIVADGKPFFTRVKSNYPEKEEIWLRQETSDPNFVWNVYSIKKVEGRTKRDLFMEFHLTQLDEKTFREELIQEDFQISREEQRIFDSKASFFI